MANALAPREGSDGTWHCNNALNTLNLGGAATFSPSSSPPPCYRRPFFPLRRDDRCGDWPEGAALMMLLLVLQTTASETRGPRLWRMHWSRGRDQTAPGTATRPSTL